MNFNWHPECFKCSACNVILADTGFVKNSLRAFCRECNLKEKTKNSGAITCQKCLWVIQFISVVLFRIFLFLLNYRTVIEGDVLRFKSDAYHPYHFNCKSCSIELNSSAREAKGELYCLKCHEKLDIPICSACHMPIDQERIVCALGKQWHVEHFVCAQCEIPFNGSRHYEKRGLAYCETHYNSLFGDLCFVCNKTISGDG